MVSAPHFSPNSDGRKDATVFAVTSSEPAFLDVYAVDHSGNIVRILARDRLVERDLGVAWDGMRSDGTPVSDGMYQVVIEARDAAGSRSSAAATVRVDTAAPQLTWASHGGVLRSSPLTIRFRVRDASTPLAAHFELVNAYGRVVRAWEDRSIAPGARSSTVARRVIGATVPGVYRVRATMRDAAGNWSLARRSPVFRVDHAVRARVVARVQNAGRHVALTFDDCASPSSWASILRTLSRARIKGAFFCPGQAVQSAPGLAARTVRAGHTIGSHGWDHALLTASGYRGTLPRLTRDRNVWWRWHRAATPYFRPPYGAYNSSVLAAAGDAGYRYAVVWDVDPRDWTSPGVGAIVSRSVRPARAGSIILLHVKPQTAQALPQLIRALRARGLAPIGLDELLHRRGASTSHGGWTPRLARPILGDGAKMCRPCAAPSQPWQ